MDPVEEPPAYEPASNFERAVLDRITALQQQVDVVSQMVCPVCGPPIHARNHPDKISFGHDHDAKNGTGPDI